MTIKEQFYLPTEQATENFGRALASCLMKEGIIYLIGELGAGKTSLARGFIRGSGFQGVVKSPTYTLVETYQLEQKTIHHFDLYRLVTPEELEFMGIRDYFVSSICLVEWPERAKTLLPLPDVSCYIDIENNGRCITLEINTNKIDLSALREHITQ